jgi:hypothetical protein
MMIASFHSQRKGKASSSSCSSLPGRPSNLLIGARHEEECNRVGRAGGFLPARAKAQGTHGLAFSCTKSHCSSKQQQAAKQPLASSTHSHRHLRVQQPCAQINSLCCLLRPFVLFALCVLFALSAWCSCPWVKPACLPPCLPAYILLLINIPAADHSEHDYNLDSRSAFPPLAITSQVH